MTGVDAVASGREICEKSRNLEELSRVFNEVSMSFTVFKKQELGFTRIGRE